MSLPTSVSGLTAADHRDHHEDIHETFNILTGDDAIVTEDRLTFAGTMWNPQSDILSVAFTVMSGRGTGTVSERGAAYRALVQDNGLVANKAVTGAVNNGSGLIRLTAAGHGLATGDKVAVYGVGGVTAANGAWTVTVINANTLDLQGSTFAGTYTSGGTVTNRPMLTCFVAEVSPILDRGGLTGTAAAGDDVACFTASNVGTHQATDAYYVSSSDHIAGESWYSGLSIDAKCEVAIAINNDCGVGIDLSQGTFSTGAMIIPNNAGIYGRNAADNNNLGIFRINNSDEAELMTKMYLGDLNIRLGTTTGTKIGTATNEKLGFYNATPIVKQTGVAVTAGGVHAALVNLGLIAA